MKTPRWFTRNHLSSHLRIATAVTLTSAAAALAFVAANNSSPSLSGKSARKSEAKIAKLEMRSVRNKALANHFKTLIGRNKSSGEASPIDGLAQEAYDNRAYPAKWIAPAQRKNARAAANAILTKSNTLFSPLAAPVLLPTASWVDLGPSGVPASGLVVNESTAGTTGTIFSGRTTAIAVGPNCSLASCTVFIGAAGGGVWKTSNALAATLSWTQVSDGQIPSNAIGSIVFDPNDGSGNTLYVGTGEPNGSSDSEAGVGLYKSTDGGAHFTAAKILAQDVVAPGSANGGDFFRGGCSHIELYRPGSETQVYASFFDYGVFRRSNTLDSNSNFNQIFGSLGGGSVGLSSFFRTEFSLAPNGSNLRIYVGDGGAPPPTLPDGFQARFFRVDNANVAAA